MLYKVHKYLQSIDAFSVLLIIPFLIGAIIFLVSFIFTEYQPVLPMFSNWPSDYKKPFIFEQNIFFSSIVNIFSWSLYLYLKKNKFENYFSNLNSYKYKAICLGVLPVLLFVIISLIIFAPQEEWGVNDKSYLIFNSYVGVFFASCGIVFMWSIAYVSFTLLTLATWFKKGN